MKEFYPQSPQSILYYPRPLGEGKGEGNIRLNGDGEISRTLLHLPTILVWQQRRLAVESPNPAVFGPAFHCAELVLIGGQMPTHRSSKQVGLTIPPEVLARASRLIK